MKFQVKGFSSLLLAAAILALGCSGIILYLAPRGRVANWTLWSILGLEKRDWQAIHISLALLVLTAAALHVYQNWPIFWGYLKKKGRLAPNLKLELLSALLLVGSVLAGAILRIPPLGTIVDIQEHIRDSWERRAAEPPTPHAEELSLGRLADVLGLAASDLQDALQAEGIAAADADATVAQVAKANGLTPADVYAAVKKHFPEARQHRKGQGRG